MVPVAGYVYFQEDFQFPDGSTGRKLFVVLCDSPLDPSNVLVVRTTSKPKGPKIQGCYAGEKVPNYFVPKTNGSFKEDTWVQFNYVVEMQSVKLEKRFREPLFQLSMAITAAILTCAAESRFVEITFQNACKALAENLS